MSADSDFTAKTSASTDFIRIFVRSAAELERQHATKYDGLLWISYPKGSSKVKTDLNRDILWQKMAKHKLAGIALVSLDDTWSATRFRPSDKVGK